MNCPDCDEEMEQEEISQDIMGSEPHSHTTLDGYVWICPKCGREIEVDDDPDDGDDVYEMDRDNKL